MEYGYKVIVQPEGIELEMKEGDTIMQAAKRCGIYIDAPCGGNGSCKKCVVQIKIQGEKKNVCACQTVVTEHMEIWIPKKETHKILLEGWKKEIQWNPVLTEEERKVGAYMAAIDIGTTTLAGYLINGNTGEVAAKASLLNPQTAYGADIMERCRYSLQHGIKQLKEAVLGGINEILFLLSQEAGIELNEIMAFSVAGNPCMNHIFGEFSLQSLVEVPYRPAFYHSIKDRASKYHLNINKNALVLLLPNIGGFVGSDTVMAMLCADFDNTDCNVFLIDIGTNGEMAVGNRHKRIACSTAAGPAFEGVNIACGMRGANGAIDHVSMVNGQLSISTIGGEKPIGICGSGLIDVVALMVTYGFVDCTGRIAEKNELTHLEAKKNQHRIYETNGEKAFLLVSPKVTGNGREIYISQQDIRELQLAKGAILAGIHTLLRKMELEEQQVEKVYLAGAFGFYLTKENACKIGMIPKAWKDKILLLGNGAGEGAKEVLINKEHLYRSERLAKETEFLELASSDEFQKEFMKCMDFNV